MRRIVVVRNSGGGPLIDLDFTWPNTKAAIPLADAVDRARATGRWLLHAGYLKRSWVVVLTVLLSRSFAAAAGSETCPSVPHHPFKHEGKISLECVLFEGHRFAVVSAKLDAKIYASVIATDHKSPLADFDAYAPSEDVLVVMNGGIYKPTADGGFEPEGLLVHEGKEKERLNVDDPHSRTNFYWKPNGVFWIDRSGVPHISETAEFARVNSGRVLEGTQSGPLLVMNGGIHPQPGTNIPEKSFLESSSVFIRNGIGVRNGSELELVISMEPVRMLDLARLFLERLKCRDALYLDGAISEMYLPGGIDKKGRSVVDTEGAPASNFVTMIGISAKK